MIEHQIKCLSEAGVTDIVLAVNYRPEVMVNQLKCYEEQVSNFYLISWNKKKEKKKFN